MPSVILTRRRRRRSKIDIDHTQEGMCMATSPSLRFSSLSFSVHLCEMHLTFHHSMSCPISQFPPYFAYAFLTVLCPYLHISALALRLSAFHSSVRPSYGTIRITSFCTFQRPQKRSNLTKKKIKKKWCMSLRKFNSSTYRQQNRLNTYIVIV
jgi:hypothetical protein